jgi:ribosomal protein S18 acetylase RimI-like enzyme
MTPEVTYRTELVDRDPASIRDLVRATGFFYDDEVAVAGELAEERLAKGPGSGYHFVLADQGERLLGYTCYGPIACTRSSHDLYWIAVAPDAQRLGLGRALMRRSEAAIAAAGGTRVYVETSNRPQYASTRAFYERCGYDLVSLLEEFYGPGDAKATYCRVVGPAAPAQSTSGCT